MSLPRLTPRVFRPKRPKKRLCWPPKYKGVETPWWLYTPRESYPPGPDVRVR